MQHYSDIAKLEKILQTTSEITKKIRDIAMGADGFLKAEQGEVLLSSQTSHSNLSCALSHLALANRIDSVFRVKVF
jgi:hypothetical protein